MSRFIPKTLFFLVFLLSLSFQASFTQNHAPHLKPQQAIYIKDTSEELWGKPEMNEGMLPFISGEHTLGFGKKDIFIASDDCALRIEFVNARPVSPMAEEITLEKVDSSKAAMPLGRVTYKDLWDGVTLKYERHSHGVVKSTYTVWPTGSGSSSPVERIRLRYNVPVEVDETGSLVFSFETGEMRESCPVAWQEIEGRRKPVDVSFCSLGQYDAGFKIGAYDSRLPLVIDPVLSWNTFLGGTSWDEGSGIAVDGDGNVYVAGTCSVAWGSPVNAHAGGDDAFVAKLNSNGALLWHTFLGSANDDHGTGIALDGSGNILLTGYSYASWGMPVESYAGGDEAFVAKLDSNGALLWNTFLGSTDDDYGHGLALDAAGNVFVTGYSYASWGSPVNAYAGGDDAFVAKLNSNGALLWNTFLGSANDDHGTGIALDKSGNVYVTGDSDTSWGSPVNAYAGGSDAFAAKLNSTGVRLWHTFLGSSSNDNSFGIAADTSGGIFIIGSSRMTWGTPISAHAGGSDAFVAKLSSNGALLWNTFLGSSNDDYGHGLALDATGNVFVTGYSWETWGMPVEAHAGGTDIFAAKLNSYGIRYWNTFVGGLAHEYSEGLAVDGSGNVYVTGNGDASWGTPVNPFAGVYDAFVAKIFDMNIYVFDGHDFNGNGMSDATVFRPSNGKWYIKGFRTYVWGTAGDIPVNGDYNGSGTTDIAVWRPSNGWWYIRGRAGTGWGTSGDIPVPGNYDGDVNGTTEIAVWRPSNGRWYIQGIGGSVWGVAGDIPVPGDYDGDGTTDIAVWRPSNGRWHIKGIAGAVWGRIGDIPVPADYDGDGTTDIAVWRPSNGRWYIKGLAGAAWGTMNDIPSPGDYDGDGAEDIAVWRPSNGRWYIKGIGGYIWGTLGDIPLVR